MRSPSPTTQIKLTLDFNPDEIELEEIVEDWVAARRAPTGAVAVVPQGVDIINDGDTDTELFLAATNAVAVQIGQLLNIPAVLLDASVEAGASLSYQNMENQRSWWIDTALSFWLTPIEARLSMDDVTPRGTHIAFDLSYLTTVPAPETPQPLED